MSITIEYLRWRREQKRFEALRRAILLIPNGTNEEVSRVAQWYLEGGHREFEDVGPDGDDPQGGAEGDAR